MLQTYLCNSCQKHAGEQKQCFWLRDFFNDFQDTGGWFLKFLHGFLASMRSVSKILWSLCAAVLVAMVLWVLVAWDRFGPWHWICHLLQTHSIPALWNASETLFQFSGTSSSICTLYSPQVLLAVH